MLTTLIGSFCALACSLSPAGMPAHNTLRIDANCAICRVYVGNASDASGIYIDDGVQQHCQLARQAAIDGYWPIIVGIWGKEHGCKVATWNAVEWYPPVSHGKIPKSSAYILPWFDPWSGNFYPPILREKLFAAIMKRHPSLVLYFYVNDGYDVQGQPTKYVKPLPPVL